MIQVTYEEGRLYVSFPFNPLDNIKAKSIPERRWSKKKGAWSCRPTLANIQYIEGAWTAIEWLPAAQDVREEVYQKKKTREEVLSSKREGVETSALDSVPFKKPPMQHQKIALMLGRDKDSFAYLMDQGTGKTKALIDDACHNWRENRIDVVLVFTLNSVKTNWVMFDCMKDEPEDVDAVTDHMPPDVPYVKGVWVSAQRGDIKKEWKKFELEISNQVNAKDKLVWLAANIESLRVDRAFDFYERVIEAFQGRVMICVDESTLIGQPGSKQTKAAMKLRKLCHKARIMSGTPVIKSPMKAYSQFSFLDEDILGFGSFYSFRNHFCIMGGYKDKQILYYQNLDELNEKIASCSYRVLKSECLDLPPQTFLKRRVEMTAEQAKAYSDMKENFVAQNEKSGRVEAKIVLEQMLRLQQITGGYLPIIKEDKVVGVTELVAPKDNPKFKEVMNILSEAGDQRMIVWTRFTHEVLAITKLLNDNGYEAMSFYGGLDDSEKIGVRKRFARGEGRVIVGNPAAGGLGIDEFKHASLVAYVTNSYDTEKRKQSEDRTHRYGSDMHEAITYNDIIIPNTVDIKILSTLRNNVKISAAVMGDEWKEWI